MNVSFSVMLVGHPCSHAHICPCVHVFSLSLVCLCFALYTVNFVVLFTCLLRMSRSLSHHGVQLWIPCGPNQHHTGIESGKICMYYWTSSSNLHKQDNNKAQTMVQRTGTARPSSLPLVR